MRKNKERLHVPIYELVSTIKRHIEIEQEETIIPNWHFDKIEKRLECLNTNPDQAIDFETTMDNLEKELNV